MVVNGFLFDDGLPDAECSGKLDVGELCDGDPDGLGPGPAGELHVSAKRHVTDTRAVDFEWNVHN